MCRPSSWSLVQEMRNYISHSALDAKGCPFLCLVTYGSDSSRSPVGGRYSEGWEGIRVWSQGCGASQQLWLGLEPLTCFFPSPHLPQGLKKLELFCPPPSHQREQVWKSDWGKNGRDEFAGASFFPVTPLQTTLSKA